MRTAVTLCRVPEAAAGPFVFHDSLDVGFAKAKAAGFSEVELFLPAPGSIEEILKLQDTHGLGIAAVGTGAGMVRQGLSLTDPDPEKRRAALNFVISMIEFGGKLGAPAILGSMQGRWGGDVSREQALQWLAESLRVAGETAANYEVPFIYEPLNRYETNLINRLGDGADWIESESLHQIVLLADLFHMNIEEADIAAALIHAGRHVGHVHFADSNRHAMGLGHTDLRPIAGALKQIGYNQCLSAEIFPLPDPDTAARKTIEALTTFSQLSLSLP
jgi:sugar phosphate isomerase/epimerase